MRRFFAILLSTVALAGFAQGQSASDLNESTRLTHDSVNDTWSFSWWGRTGRTYFIQQSDDLMSWQYIPIIEPGQENVVEWGFATNADRLFMRLKYTDVPTLDPWGEDFDGDNIGNWDELLQESDPFATLDLNSNGIPDDWELFWDDQFGAFPKPITASLTHRESITKQLHLSNPVTPDGDFTVTVTNNLAGTQVVYDYEDSLTGGAIYNWTEISTTGTLLTGISDVVDGYEEVTLLNFAFPFYGTSYNSVFVSSNGMLAFGSGTSAYSNQAIPNTSNPDNFIAPFWDDHNTSTAGEIYVQELSDRLIVQYEAVAPYSGTGSYTYQAVLHSSGLIEFFYKEMVGNVESATVGLENADGTDGLEIAYNEPYIQEGLAARISQGPAYFVKVSPLTGTTTTGAISALNVTFNTFDLAPGTYTADIDIAHTGTGTSPWNVPAVLEVTNPPATISITSPSTESVFWMDEDADIYVSASDSDFGIERVDFYADATFIGEDTAASYRLFNWTPPLPGTYSLTARAVDQFGTESISNPVQVSFLADSDQDRMPDPWETDVFGSIIPEALEDHDFDGFPNIFEYHHGTDPTDPLSFPVFSATQSTVSPLSNVGAVNYYIVDGTSNALYQKSTIQSAINAAGEFDIIEVRGGVYDESLNISKRLYVFSSDGARSTIIDGGGRNDNVVYISQESVIEGFSIQNGNRSSDGGGLYFYNSSAQNKFRLVGCLIRNNRAGDQGGAVYINYGNVTFVSCTIADNFAEQANGIYIARSSASATLVNTLIWNTGGTEINGFTANTFQTKTILRDPISGNALLDNVDTGSNNPGIGYDLALTSTSIARNAGTTFLYARRDADGEILSDGAKDIGVDEFHDSDANGLPDWLENLAGGVLVASVDGDGDSLTNLEDYIYGANPFSNDTDGDGLLDGDETFGDGTHGDTDGYVSSAKYLDADFDGMSDAWEVSYNLDPGESNNATLDGDGDGLDNLSEFNLGTNPSAMDTDGDGLSDAIESSILASIDPNNFYYLDPTNADTDGDGINDGDDSDDGDTLSNLEELALGTDLNLADTDADGVFDDVEVDIGTDPTTSNDFANADSDGDGLSDLFELNFGTDPNDADTNDNGMNDGEELDNGGDPINPGPPPPPLNPETPPGPDPDPTSPDPIVPGDYDILIEAVSVSQTKHGFAPYQEINPTKRYLTQSSSQSFSGGCPESGPRGVSGNKTTTIDPLTGNSETTGDTFVNSGGTAESPTRKSGTSQISSYDDPPNEKGDCTGTIRYNSHLSNEYTTSTLISNAMSELPDYEGEFVAGTPYAYRNLHENELRFDYQSVKFKFKWHDDVVDEQRFPITYYVLWTPEDDPETQDVDESEAVEIVDTIEWSGNAAESQVFEIEPNSLKSGQDGDYSLIRLDLDIIHPATGILGELEEDAATDSGIVAVRIDEHSPVTRLKIHAVPSLPSDSTVSLSFNTLTHYKIWRDAERTEEVISFNTKFPANEETVLFIEGLTESTAESAESIRQVYTIGTSLFLADSIKFTVLEAEFHVWLSLFIPVQWGDLPAAFDVFPPFGRKIFGGDDRGFYALPFNNPNDDVDNFIQGSSSRVHQQITVIPFRVLDDDGIKDDSLKQYLGTSHNYLKSTSVPDPSADYSITNRLLLNPQVTDTDRGTVAENNMDITVQFSETTPNTLLINFGSSADNPIVTPSFPINWNLDLRVNSENVFLPGFVLTGKQDGFPAYEMYIRDSDGDQGAPEGTVIHQYDPIPLGLDPTALEDGVNDVNVYEQGTVE